MTSYTVSCSGRYSRVVDGLITHCLWRKYFWTYSEFRRVRSAPFIKRITTVYLLISIACLVRLTQYAILLSLHHYMEKTLSLATHKQAHFASFLMSFLSSLHIGPCSLLSTYVYRTREGARREGLFSTSYQ